MITDDAIARIRAGEEVTLTTPEYTVQAARDAQASGYGDRAYWNYLEDSAYVYHRYYTDKGDHATAAKMLTRSLGEALQGNNGL